MVYFQINIFQFQTLNFIVKVVLFCKRTATYFKHVIVCDKLQERATERRSFCYPTGIERPSAELMVTAISSSRCQNHPSSRNSDTVRHNTKHGRWFPKCLSLAVSFNSGNSSRQMK